MVILICYGSNVFAAEALLGWNPNSETDLAGYKVYYGTSPENYSVAIDVGQTNTPSAPSTVSTISRTEPPSILP